jgi:capsular polysaccharide biosynthesis protein
MEMRTWLREIWRYVLIIVVAVVATAAFAYVVTSLGTKTYTADARIVVTAGLGTNGAGLDDILAAPQVGQTYATMATTRPILEEVVDRARLPYDASGLAERLRVTTEANQPFLILAVTDEDPELAAAATAALADVLVEASTSTVTNASGEATQVRLLSIVEQAEVPAEPSGPRVLFNTALSAGVALVVVLFGLAFVAYVRDGQQAEPTTGT